MVKLSKKLPKLIKSNKFTKKKLRVQVGGTNIDDTYTVNYYIQIGNYMKYLKYTEIPDICLLLRILNNIYQKNDEPIYINMAPYSYDDIYIEKLKIPFGITRMIPLLKKVRQYHTLLIIYLKKRVNKFLLGTIGVSGSIMGKDYNSCEISFPDNILYKHIIQNEFLNGDEIIIKKVRTDKEHILQLNKIGNNIIFLITIVYIFYDIQLHCYKCRSFNMMNYYKCDTCNANYKKFMNHDIISHNRLSFGIEPVINEDDINLNSVILYGKFSIFGRHGVNCQVFSNLMFNLLRGNPTNFKGSPTYYSIVKRLLMIKYLYEINNQFLKQRDTMVPLQYIELFRLVNARLYMYIGDFVFTSFILEDEYRLKDTQELPLTKNELLIIFKEAHKNMPQLYTHNYDEVMFPDIEEGGEDEPETLETYNVQNPRGIRVYKGITGCTDYD